MTNKYKKQLETNGVNLMNALNRFVGSEALYEKFLVKFLQDETYKHLEESINAGDTGKAFLYAHTMKGLAGNLEMGCLSDILIPMTNQLREGKMEDIPEQLSELKIRYNELCSIIQENK